MSRSLGHVVLAGARDLLRTPDDWAQGAFRQGRRRCVDEAIVESARRITKSRKDRRAVAHSARRLIFAQMGFRHARDIHRWNDDNKRTFAEVVGLLDRCLAA